jgi:3-oxoacyl-[acyl-carrier-protein] synthase-3
VTTGNPNSNRTTIIRGSGIYTPPGVVTNDMLGRIMDTTDEWITQRTGIRERRYLFDGDEQEKGSMALGAKAAEAALANCGLTAADIDFLIFATMTPDLYFPGNGGLCAARLGMKNTHALDIRMQCAGFLSAMQVADAFIRAGVYKRVLVIGAESHTGLMPWGKDVWDVLWGRTDEPCNPEWFEKITGLRDRAVIFGDGAGAMVLEANDSGDGRGFLGFVMQTDGNQWERLHVPGVGSRFWPYVSHEMVDSFASVPIVEGRQVFRLAALLMPEAVKSVLGQHGKTLEDLDLLLMHQANLRINEAVQKQLGLPDEKVFNNIHKYGNTTAGTLPIAFHEATENGKVPPGSLLVFTALGAGVHWGAAACQM